MNVAMLTPLFPPDTSDSAAYVKLLAARLDITPITVIAYGLLPEAVAGIPMVSIDKSGWKIMTVVRCLHTLQKIKPTTLLVHNGQSTDVPALLYKMINTRLQLVYIQSDLAATTRTNRFWYRWVNQEIKRRAVITITLPADSDRYLPQEILPFATIDNDRTVQQDTWWQSHLTQIKSYVR